MVKYPMALNSSELTEIMNSGSGNKRSQATKEVKRAEDDVSGSIPICCF